MLLAINFDSAVKHITIIGGGLSGVLLSINLLEQASAMDSVIITLIDRHSENEMGPAYSSKEECLLLNVPACKMGALPTDPLHFLSWARNKGMRVGEWDFLPRKLYREYLYELLEKALQKNKGSTLKRIHDAVNRHHCKKWKSRSDGKW